MPAPSRVLLAAVLAGGAVVATEPASAAPTIQPGARITILERNFSTFCTLGWVYDGVGRLAGRTFVATASHCVRQGAGGQDVTLQEAPGEAFGDVATMGDLRNSAGDWALIEVRPEFEHRVSAAMLNHPEFPTGPTSAQQTKPGDSLQLNDLYGVPRTVRLTFDDAATQRVTGTVTTPPSELPSDSGGPVAHAKTGRALGTVSRGFNCPIMGGDIACEQFEGPTVEGVLRQAKAKGFAITLRTA